MHWPRLPRLPQLRLVPPRLGRSLGFGLALLVLITLALSTRWRHGDAGAFLLNVGIVLGYLTLAVWSLRQTPRDQW